MRACADTPVDAFFTEGAPSREIIDLCRGCDERIECGHEALQVPVAYDLGYRAGMTSSARKQLRTRRSKPPARFSTILGTCLECDRPLMLEHPEAHDNGERLTAVAVCARGHEHPVTVTLGKPRSTTPNGGA